MKATRRVLLTAVALVPWLLLAHRTLPATTHTALATKSATLFQARPLCSTLHFFDLGQYNVGDLGGGTIPYSNIDFFPDHQDASNYDYTWYAPLSPPRYYNTDTRTTYEWKLPFVKYLCVDNGSSTTITSFGRTGIYSGYSQKMSQDYDDCAQIYGTCSPTGGSGPTDGTDPSLWCLYRVWYNDAGDVIRVDTITCWYQ